MSCPQKIPRRNLFLSILNMTVWNQLFTHLTRETRKLENLVFNRLCRLFGRDKVYFLRDERGHEVDFLVTRRDGYDTYQVCQYLTDENASREFRPLLRLQKNDTGARGEKNRFFLV